tara:strand:- start:718 stop:840 length:123 start_codon:yes stop_codon:yes gene_type:complete
MSYEQVLINDIAERDERIAELEKELEFFYEKTMDSTEQGE